MRNISTTTTTTAETMRTRVPASGSSRASRTMKRCSHWPSGARCAARHSPRASSWRSTWVSTECWRSAGTGRPAADRRSSVRSAERCWAAHSSWSNTSACIRERSRTAVNTVAAGSPAARPWSSTCRYVTSLYYSCCASVLLSRPFFRSRDQDRDLGHQVSRPRPGSSGLETETWVFRFRDQVRDLGRQVSRLRPRPGQNELECTRVSRPWSRDHNTVVLTVVLILFLICIYPMSQKNGTTILHNGITSQSDGRFSLFFRC